MYWNTEGTAWECKCPEVWKQSEVKWSEHKSAESEGLHPSAAAFMLEIQCWSCSSSWGNLQDGGTQTWTNNQMISLWVKCISFVGLPVQHDTVALCFPTCFTWTHPVPGVKVTVMRRTAETEEFIADKFTHFTPYHLPGVNGEKVLLMGHQSPGNCLNFQCVSSFTFKHPPPFLHMKDKRNALIEQK